MLKYIFAVLLIAAVWGTVILLEFPMWIAIVATVVIVAILATVVIYRIVKAKKAAREIEKALQAQADQHASRARPDLQADIESLRGEFTQAVAALKTSKLGGKSAAEALYALPWYMIIGPPGSGKSTALRNSGLRFPYLSKNGGGVQGVGGTRNCQWWMTNDAVILDTAGRYTTEDSDHEEWMAFLELLKKNRPKAPVNGVMVAIAVTDLTEAHPEQVVAQAREIRSRIDEVMNRLEMVVPVYLLFTKCDLLPGFVETFGDLGNTERSQIWGFTFPVTKKERDPVGAFAERFSELAATIERRAVRRMSEERSLEGRDKIYAFPQYFEPMRDTLATFAGELFAENIYNESPIMRGCYFTSGTQEGRPIDRIMNGMAEAFGIQPRMQMSVQPQHVEAKSYFLGQLFTKVIFPDRFLASRSASRVRRQKLVGHGVGVGLIGVAGGMVALPVNSFQNNRELLSETKEAVARVNEHYATKEETESTDPIRIENIEPLRKVERKLAEYEDDGPPWLSRMGMYQGATVYPSIRDLYFTAVREELLIPIRNIDENALERFKLQYQGLSEPAPNDEQAANKDRLRMYLLLTLPVEGGRPEGEPGLANEDERAWLTEQITELWEKPLGDMGDVASKAEMRGVAAAYVDILAADDSRLFERDEKLVTAVRKILMRADRTQALLDQILAEVDAPDIELRLATDTRGALKNDGRKVRGAYTRTAWEEHLQTRLYEPLGDLMGDEWVLGISEDEMKEDRDKQLAQLRSMYFEQYIQEWTSFIKAIYVDPPDNYASVLKTLEDLTRTPGSYKRLCQYVSYHTNLQPPQPDMADEASEGLMDAAKEQGLKAAEKSGKAGRVAGGIARKRKKKGPKMKGASLLKDEYSVVDAFSGLVAFGYSEPAPTPEGAPPLPPAAVPIDDYNEELRKLRTALKSKIDNDTEDDAKALSKAVKSAGDVTDSLLNDTDAREWTPVLDKWLRPPIRALERVTRGDEAGSMNKSWCDEVVRPFDKMSKRYPFNPKGREVTLAEFGKYFKPESGQLWAFYYQILVGRVPRRHGGYEIVKRGAKVSNTLNPKVAEFLNRAQDVTTVMYPDGASDPEFAFNVQVQGARKAVASISETKLVIDGQTIAYKNGPYEWASVTWPGEDKPGGHISARGFGNTGEVGPHEGEWGLFRLLEAGTDTGDATKDQFRFEWDIRDQDTGILTVLMQPKLDDTPIYGTRTRGVKFMEVFRHADLRPPRTLIIGGPSCE